MNVLNNLKRNNMNIPTAEEFLQQSNVVGMTDLMTPLMIEFAKLHVESALKAAWENAEIKQDIFSESGEPIYEINHLSILNAYPLENII